MTTITDTRCRVCHEPIRLTALGTWGHVRAYRVGLTHPLHRARP